MYECKYHLVLCPKYRKDLFADQLIREYTGTVLGEIAREYDGEIEAMEIADDHVHLLVEIPPKRAVSDFARAMKSISARELFKRFPGIKKRLWAGELWKDGYFVKSVGSGVTKEVIKKYIETHKMKEGSPAQLELD